MSQAQSDSSKNAPLGVQAAAAATSGGGGGKPATTTPAANASKPAAEGPAEEAKKKGSNKLFIVVGQVHEFETYAQAEKFLNADGAPASYSVLRGKKLKTNSKVTLR